MMIPTSPERILMLIRARYLALICGGVLSSTGALIVGLMAPYLYRSEASIQLAQPKATEFSLSGDSSDLLRAANLARSSRVLEKVAEELTKDGSLEQRVVAPLSISTFDLRYRLGLLFTSLGRTPPSLREPSVLPPSLPPAILANFLGQHLRVDPDTNLRTLRISYEAGDPNVAQRVCQQIADTHIAVTLGFEREELHRQEAYLDSAIKRQLESIQQVETKMRDIVERYPEMSASKDNQQGTVAAARKFIEKQELLKRLETELHSNDTILGAIKKELSQGNELEYRIAGDLVEKLTDEIGALELKLLQYTKVAGYRDDHPEVKGIRQKILVLTKILNASNSISKGTPESASRSLATDALSLKGLLQQRVDLRDKNRRLNLEQRVLKKEIQEQSTAFKEIVKVNFAFDAYVRELATNVAVTNDLYRELQKTRLMMAGVVPSVSVLAPATLGLHPVNVSVRKRTVFGFFVGLALVISFLLILDLIYPVLVSLDDFSLLNIKHFGQFQIQKRCISQVAHCIMSLGDTDPVRSPEGRPGRVAAFWQMSVQFSFESLLEKLVADMTQHGCKVAVIQISDSDLGPELRHAAGTATQGSVERVELALDSIPSKLAPLVREMRSRCDWIFVTGSASSNASMERFIGMNSDYFFFVAEIGRSNLKSMKRLMQIPDATQQLKFYGLPFRM